MAELEIIKTGTSFQKYYSSLNDTYNKIFNKYLMLHYPFFKKEGESLENRQVNLTNHCISKLRDIKGKKVLEVGCGNGTQCIYIAENYSPSVTIGIDLNPENIELAEELKGQQNSIDFYIDDAHFLEKIEDNSVDTLICIESAFHYPDKNAFLKQVRRVLKSDGEFLIADILSKTIKKRFLIAKWKRKMYYHHWTFDMYEKAFADAELKVSSVEELTPSIIKGYSGFKKWITRKDCSSAFNFFIMQVFMIIQVKLNVMLLKRRRKYMLFIGK